MNYQIHIQVFDGVYSRVKRIGINCCRVISMIDKARNLLRTGIQQPECACSCRNVENAYLEGILTLAKRPGGN